MVRAVLERKREVKSPADIWKDLPGKYFCISVKSRGGRWADNFFTRDEFDDIDEFIAEQADGGDVYWCPHGFTRKERKKEFAVAPKLLWADLDAINPETVACKPTIAWESSPGHYQALWKVDREPDEGTRKAFNASLGVGIDPGWHLTKALRVPGTFNHKPERRANGHTPEVELLWSDGPAHKLADLSIGKANGKDDSTSGLFHREVCKLAERGWSVDKIEADIRKRPTKWKHTKAAEYEEQGRLGEEIKRSYEKAGAGKAKTKRTLDLTHMHKRTVRMDQCLTVSQWLKRKIDPPDPLLGELFSTTSRVLFFADTGIGKTMVALAWAFALAFGRDFLRWDSKRKARVLFVDGEMPRDLLQDRLQLMCRLLKIKPDETHGQLSVLSKEDYDDMQPLDTEEGQVWLDEFIKAHGPFDFIVFDNIMTLCSGIMKEEESWQALKPYVLGLTKRRIGQLWIHHTGHDATHSYGTKTREWQMDTVIKAESLSTDHINFNLIFKKHTRSKPSNYEDFEDMHIELLDREWVHSEAVEKVGGRPTKRREIVLQALKDAMGRDIDASEEEWRNRAIELGISKSRDRESQRRAFNRARDDVIKDAVRPKAGRRYAFAS